MQAPAKSPLMTTPIAKHNAQLILDNPNGNFNVDVKTKKLSVISTFNFYGRLVKYITSKYYNDSVTKAVNAATVSTLNKIFEENITLIDKSNEPGILKRMYLWLRGKSPEPLTCGYSKLVRTIYDFSNNHPFKKSKDIRVKVVGFIKKENREWEEEEEKDFENIKIHKTELERIQQEQAQLQSE